MNEGSFPNFGIRILIFEFSKYNSFAKALWRERQEEIAELCWLEASTTQWLGVVGGAR